MYEFTNEFRLRMIIDDEFCLRTKFQICNSSKMTEITILENILLL